MDDRVPAWVAYSGVAVVGSTALTVLAYYQHLLGLHAGMPWLLSWSFSIGLDWGSATAGIFWLFGSPHTQVWGRTTTISLLTGSTVLTCLAWGMQAGWWWAPLGIVHPVVAATMAKLLTVWQAERGAAPVVDTPELPRLTPADDHIDRARQLIADGAGRPRLARELHITDHQARQLLTKIRDETAA